MNRRDRAELAAFVGVAYYLSFRAAASCLDVTPSALSHSMRQLEEQLGVRLLRRTTRSVSVTDAGLRLLEVEWLLNREVPSEALKYLRLDALGRLGARTLLIIEVARSVANRPLPVLWMEREAVLRGDFVDRDPPGKLTGWGSRPGVSVGMIVIRPAPRARVPVARGIAQE
jgi:hypothetical protein